MLTPNQFQALSNIAKENNLKLTKAYLGRAQLYQGKWGDALGDLEASICKLCNCYNSF